MPSLEIKKLFAVTEDNLEIFNQLWDECDGHDSDRATQLIDEHKALELVEITSPDKPFAPNPGQEATILRLWENPAHPGNPKYMVGLFVDLKEGDEGVEEHPRNWVLGEKANMIALYRMSCCGGYSTFLTGLLDGWRDYKTLDDARNTHDNQKKLFETDLREDAGGELEHSYLHIKGKDHKCSSHAALPKPAQK